MSTEDRISATDASNSLNDEIGVRRALELMREALELLDGNHGPHDVRAHLDDAINRLQRELDGSEG
ncbi:MAG TPA: hypothetical protein VGD23_12285 [Sphingomicrobium sp.]